MVFCGCIIIRGAKIEVDNLIIVLVIKIAIKSWNIGYLLIICSSSWLRNLYLISWSDWGYLKLHVLLAKVRLLSMKLNLRMRVREKRSYYIDFGFISYKPLHYRIMRVYKFHTVTVSTVLYRHLILIKYLII